MKLGSRAGSFLFAAVMAVASSAIAQEPPPEGTSLPPPTQPPPPSSSIDMGSQGQIVLAADLPFMSNTGYAALVHTSHNMMIPSSNTITFKPSADYFVAPHISVGAVLLYSDGPVNFAGTTTYGLMARAGYSLNLTDVISVWARLGIGYFHSTVDMGGVDESGYVVPVLIEAPALWHPAPHFFIGAGPMLSFQLASKVDVMGTSADSRKETNFGVTTMIGGYFGGV